MIVRDAALATAETGSLRFEIEIRSADAADGVPVVTGRGQVSFREPIQFRLQGDEFTGLGGHSPEYEVIFDDSRIFLRGREAVPSSPRLWIVFDHLEDGAIVWERYLGQYGDALFVLAPALGVIEAEAAGSEAIRGNRTTHFVGVARSELASDLLSAPAREPYLERLARIRASGALRPFPLEAWVDADGRVVRVRYVQEVESGDYGPLVVTYAFEAFGDAVDLEPPDGAEVLTFDEFLERYAGSTPPPPPSPPS